MRTNELNERQLNDLVFVTSRRADSEPVEYWPGLFAYRTIRTIRITSDGQKFLCELCDDYRNGTITAEGVLSELSYVSGKIWSSADKDEIYDKLYNEVINILAN